MYIHLIVHIYVALIVHMYYVYMKAYAQDTIAHDFETFQ